jgi:hypothetical protein
MPAFIPFFIFGLVGLTAVVIHTRSNSSGPPPPPPPPAPSLTLPTITQLTRTTATVPAITGTIPVGSIVTLSYDTPGRPDNETFQNVVTDGEYDGTEPLMVDLTCGTSYKVKITIAIGTSTRSIISNVFTLLDCLPQASIERNTPQTGVTLSTNIGGAYTIKYRFDNNNSTFTTQVIDLVVLPSLNTFILPTSSSQVTYIVVLEFDGETVATGAIVIPPEGDILQST